MSNNSRSNKAINRANPVHGLEKIPTHILLKYSRQEVGKLKAYIDELEYENEMLREKLHKKRITMNKTIEKAAKEYADVAKPYLLSEEMELVQNAFEAGAEWALSNQWHSVADGDLPKELKGNSEDTPFLISFKDGDVIFAYYNEDEQGVRDFYDDCDCALEVAYWMEIPLHENNK